MYYIVVSSKNTKSKYFLKEISMIVYCKFLNTFAQNMLLIQKYMDQDHHKGSTSSVRVESKRKLRNVIEEVEDEEPSPKSAKESKSKYSKEENGPDSRKAPSLMFKLTSKVAYKTVLKDYSAVILKAENMANKIEWMNEISNLTHQKGAVKGAQGT